MFLPPAEASATPSKAHGRQEADPLPEGGQRVAHLRPQRAMGLGWGGLHLHPGPLLGIGVIISGAPLPDMSLPPSDAITQACRKPLLVPIYLRKTWNLSVQLNLHKDPMGRSSEDMTLTR